MSNILELLADSKKLEADPLMLEPVVQSKDSKSGKILFSLDELELNVAYKHPESSAVITRVNDKQVKCVYHKEEKLFPIVPSTKSTTTTSSSTAAQNNQPKVVGNVFEESILDISVNREHCLLYGVWASHDFQHVTKFLRSIPRFDRLGKLNTTSQLNSAPWISSTFFDIETQPPATTTEKKLIGFVGLENSTDKYFHNETDLPPFKGFLFCCSIQESKKDLSKELKSFKKDLQKAYGKQTLPPIVLVAVDPSKRYVKDGTVSQTREELNEFVAKEGLAGLSEMEVTANPSFSETGLEVIYLGLNSLLRKFGVKAANKPPQPVAISSTFITNATSTASSVVASSTNTITTKLTSFMGKLGIGNAAPEEGTPQPTPRIKTSLLAKMQHEVPSILKDYLKSVHTGSVAETIDVGVTKVHLSLSDLGVSEVLERHMKVEVTTSEVFPEKQQFAIGSASSGSKEEIEEEKSLEGNRKTRDFAINPNHNNSNNNQAANAKPQTTPATTTTNKSPYALYFEISLKDLCSSPDRLSWKTQKPPKEGELPSISMPNTKMLAFQTLTGIKNPFSINSEGEGIFEVKSAHVYVLLGLYLPLVPNPSLFNKHPKPPAPQFHVLSVRVRVKEVRLELDSSMVQLAAKGFGWKLKDSVEAQLHPKILSAIDGAVTKTFSELLVEDMKE